MKCPVCKESLIVVELDQVEVDHCLECKGVWLDAGELELLTGNHDEAIKFLDSMKKSASKEKKRKCPVCLHKMEKVEFTDSAKTLVDKCKKDHGLWLDQGELETLLHASGLGEDAPVLALLKDMFGAEADC